MGGDRDARAVGARVRATATAGGFVLFAAMGALYAMYGPVIPSLEERFALDEGRGALVVTAHFVGTIVGILGWTALAPAMGARGGLVVGASLLTIGAVGFATGASWPLAILAASVIGLGFGTLLVGLTSTFAAAYGPRGAAILNLLTAVFGAGAIAGPLAVSAVGGERFRLAYLAGAIVAGTGLLLIASLQIPRSGARVERSGSAARALRETIRVPAFVWGFVALFVGYVGVESGVAGFIATHLLAAGLERSAAEAWGAAFWGAIMLGRIVAAPLALRIAPGAMVTGCLALALVALVAANVEAVAPTAYVAVGLALAPVFPTGLAWLAASTGPDDTSSASVVIAGAQLGGVIVPAAVGLIVGATSASLVPSTVTLVTIASLVTALALDRRLRQREEVGPGAPAHDDTTTATTTA